MLTVDLDRLGLRRGDWLLDAGCGGGRHCFGALDRGVHSVGLDLDVPSLRIARAGIHERRGKAGPVKLHGGVLQGDVFRLPFPDGAFDRVICSEVMEHVHDYGAALAELVRVLRPGGTIGVTIPTAITEWFYWAATRLYFESPGGHIRVFEPRELALALSRAARASGRASRRPDRAGRARQFLIRAAVSRTWIRVEHVLDRVFPKSLVLYGTRVASGRAPCA